jgi:acyl-coenzyme A thioesterase PaaI-like protein
MNTHHEEDRVWTEFTLGPVYEGPPGLVHGGNCALLLDQLLGEVATHQLSKPKFTGTITLKYLRGTPLGPVRGEAWVERTEGYKTYARGFLGDAQGATVEAEGIFIMPAWARDATE